MNVYSEDLRNKIVEAVFGRGMGGCLAVEGATTRVLFEAYVERVARSEPTGRAGRGDGQPLRPKRREGQELIEARGCEDLYLPPYSPELNLIEEAFSKIKCVLRRAAARTREALIDALGEAISAVGSTDALGFFGHCGYRRSGQLL
jgi:transposase